MDTQTAAAAGNRPFLLLPGHSLLGCLFRLCPQGPAGGKAPRMGLYFGLSCQYPDGVLRKALRQKGLCQPSHPEEPPARLPAALAFVTLFGIAAAIVSLVIPELISALRAHCRQNPQGGRPPAGNLLKTPTLSVFCRRSCWNSQHDGLGEPSHPASVAHHRGAGAPPSSSRPTRCFPRFPPWGLPAHCRYLLRVCAAEQGQAAVPVRPPVPPLSASLLERQAFACAACGRRLSFTATLSSAERLEASAILGVLCTVGMLPLGLPDAPMIGALIGVTALIPVAGAYIGALVGVFLILSHLPC